MSEERLAKRCVKSPRLSRIAASEVGAFLESVRVGPPVSEEVLELVAVYPEWGSELDRKAMP